MLWWLFSCIAAVYPHWNAYWLLERLQEGGGINPSESSTGYTLTIFKYKAMCNVAKITADTNHYHKTHCCVIMKFIWLQLMCTDDKTGRNFYVTHN